MPATRGKQTYASKPDIAAEQPICGLNNNHIGVREPVYVSETSPRAKRVTKLLRALEKIAFLFIAMSPAYKSRKRRPF
ncbi:hypothetical protein B0G76_8210 [Paraburkholderia sp. BL23I1N1]|nr:hypothetical protein B0G76_8210 [Paraburkholderia sp. BL23I1N1]